MLRLAEMRWSTILGEKIHTPGLYFSSVKLFLRKL